MNPKQRTALACCSLVLGFVCFFLSNTLTPAHLGYTKLVWAELKGFTEHPLTEALPTQAPYGEGVIGWEHVGATASKRRAESAAFKILGTVVEVEVAGLLAPGKGLQPTLALVDTSGSVLADFSLPLAESPFGPSDWVAQRFEIGADALGKEAKIIFRTPHNPAPGAWFAIRDRLDFYQAPMSPIKTLRFPAYGFYLIALFFLALSGAYILSGDLRKLEGHSLFFLFFVATVLIQFRSAPYFYWDEWHVLERFKNLGFPGVVYTHNEHFLPIFFAWFFLQAKLFGNHYLGFLLVSCALHAANGLLLYKLLSRLGSRFTYVREASILLSFLFVLNALHAETLQWAFEQSILLFQCFALVSMILAYDFLKEGGRWRLLVSGLGALLAPLCFGNGFSLPLQIAIVLGITRLASGDNRSRLRVEATRFLSLLALMTVLAASAALLYKTHAESTGHGIDQARPMGHLPQVAEYLWVGTQFGAILRGLGVFPALGPESALEALRFLGLQPANPFLALANVGFLLSLGVFALGAWGTKLRAESFRLWLTGELLLFSCFILPSLGRWQLGAGQSLSLRYHYSALVAVLIISLPLASFLFGCAQRTKPMWMRTIVALLFFLLLAVHFVVGKNFAYFTRQGFEHRLFVSQLSSWRKDLAKLRAENPNVDYEASGTPLSGMHPANRGTLTPGRHPNDIYAVLHWLNPVEYPE